MASTAKQHDCRSSRRRLRSGRRNRRSRSRARAAAFTKIVADSSVTTQPADSWLRRFFDLAPSVPRTSRDHLFGDPAGAGFTSWSRSKLDLDRRLAGVVKPWRLHDLRRAVATGMADIGIEPHHIEAVLNHYSGHRRGVAGTYNRSNYERAVAAALARWGDHVQALVAGREDKVVTLQRA
jgi:hypothetical protein